MIPSEDFLREFSRANIGSSPAQSQRDSDFASFGHGGGESSDKPDALISNGNIGVLADSTFRHDRVTQARMTKPREAEVSLSATRRALSGRLRWCRASVCNRSDGYPEERSEDHRECDPADQLRNETDREVLRPESHLREIWR